jgi:hypothetical protein
MAVVGMAAMRMTIRAVVGTIVTVPTVAMTTMPALTIAMTVAQSTDRHGAKANDT